MVPFAVIEKNRMAGSQGMETVVARIGPYERLRGLFYTIGFRIE